MHEISLADAAERIAAFAEGAAPDYLAELAGELTPERPRREGVCAADLARRIRGGLEAEELVDLWNVAFPRCRRVHYDEELDKICYTEGAARAAR